MEIHSFQLVVSFPLSLIGASLDQLLCLFCVHCLWKNMKADAIDSGECSKV